MELKKNMNIDKLTKLKRLQQANCKPQLSKTIAQLPKFPSTNDPKILLQWIVEVSAIAAVSSTHNQVDIQALNTCLRAVQAMLPKQMEEMRAFNILNESGWITEEIRDACYVGLDEMDKIIKTAFQKSLKGELAVTFKD